MQEFKVPAPRAAQLDVPDELILPIFRYVDTVQPPQTAQLLDLPNEVILPILCHLDTDALLYLAILCRRLHYIALPLYFTRVGMDDPTQNATFDVLDSRRDALSALQMALFIPAITELSCSFPHYETSIHHIFPHIRRLRFLLTRLAFVRKVTLILDTPGSHYSVSHRGVKTWVLEFGELLNTLLKRGCNSLTVSYGNFFCQGYDLYSTSLVTRPVSVFQKAVRHIIPGSPSGMQSEGWEISAQRRAHPGVPPMELDSESRSSSALTHFKMLGSPIPLLPPCLSWTLSALRHSPITSLELAGISLPGATWSAVLRPIANLVPALTELTLSYLERQCGYTDGLSGADILLFLAKLPRLKSLTINVSRYKTSWFPDSGPMPKLPELTHLHAPSSFMHVLKKQSLQNMESLYITLPVLPSRDMPYIGRPALEIFHRLNKYRLAPTISLEIIYAPWISSRIAADLGLVPGEDLMKALRAITRLIIYSDHYVTAPEVETLALWIARFPALVHVSLRVRGPAHDAALASIENARVISEQNPNVRSFELNGELFNSEDL
ncbi:hypothetical protein DFH09DRAFT_16659 [Mycena vulgaris]|nr:hypothetical protein DFH09DRAFT_16659 [Mycena vulgaris]